MDIIDTEGNKKSAKNWDPFIYPDSGYIPPCTVCKNSYEEFEKSSSQKALTGYLVSSS